MPATPRAVDILGEIAGLPVLKGRRPDTAGQDEDKSFAVLFETETGDVFAGSFEGESPWERHPNGDELVQVLKGAARLTILAETGPAELELTAGMMTIVPRGRWHKFHAPDGVAVMTMTPRPTEHSAEAEPPS